MTSEQIFQRFLISVTSSSRVILFLSPPLEVLVSARYQITGRNPEFTLVWPEQLRYSRYQSKKKKKHILSKSQTDKHYHHKVQSQTSSMAEETKRFAVVTGANKGIGFETVRQLASNGFVVVLTGRDEKKGLEALGKLKDSALSDNVLFHQLDVVDPASITSLADFIKIQFGKLDILVNNAGIGGVKFDSDGGEGDGIVQPKLIQTYELAEECLKTNYYGAKRTAEALIPLLQLSNSPRIVNVSSSMGQLKNIPNEWAKRVLCDDENLTEEKVDEVLEEFLKDYKEGSLEAKGWPTFLSAYTVSKAAMNAYTRIIAKKYPSFCINCVCPGFVKTDINRNTGILPVEEGAASPVRLALLPDGSPSGLFFVQQEVSSF